MAKLCIRRNTGKIFINNSNIFAVFYVSTFLLAQTPISTDFSTSVLIFASALNFASVLGLLEIYTDKHLQKTTKLTLKLFV